MTSKVPSNPNHSMITIPSIQEILIIHQRMISTHGEEGTLVIPLTDTLQ